MFNRYNCASVNVRLLLYYLFTWNLSNRMHLHVAMENRNLLTITALRLLRSVADSDWIPSGVTVANDSANLKGGLYIYYYT